MVLSHGAWLRCSTATREHGARPRCLDTVCEPGAQARGVNMVLSLVHGGAVHGQCTVHNHGARAWHVDAVLRHRA